MPPRPKQEIISEMFRIQKLLKETPCLSLIDRQVQLRIYQLRSIALTNEINERKKRPTKNTGEFAI